MSFTPRPLYRRGKSLQYVLNRRLGRPHSRCGSFGVEVTLSSAGNQTTIPRPFSLSLVTVRTAIPAAHKNVLSEVSKSRFHAHTC